jgi:FkbM family methyltransferase
MKPSVFHLDRIRGHTICPAALNSESVVIDAGAHRGEFSRTLMERYGCQCQLIEANPELATQLTEQNFNRVLPAALSAKDGFATFIKRKNPEHGGIFSWSKEDSDSTAEVVTVSLETIVRQSGLTRIDMLKLDIEGAEFELIGKTSDPLLASIGQITVEFHDFLPDFKGRGLYEKAKSRLESLGFITCCMTFRSHGDVLFINRNEIRTNLFSRRWLRHGARWLGKLKHQ